jgi:hypothetical protein
MTAHDGGVIAGFDPLDMLKNLFQPFGVTSHEFASVSTPVRFAASRKAIIFSP